MTTWRKENGVGADDVGGWMGEGVGWTGWVRGLDSQPGATLMLAAVKPCSLSPGIKTGSTY